MGQSASSRKPEQSRRRVERANVRRRLKGVFLSCPDLSEKDLRVVNLSENGLGVETDQVTRAPEIGSVSDAEFRVGYTRTPARVRLVHLNPQVSGLEFMEPSESLKNAIRAIFQPELAGARMRVVGHRAKKTLMGPREVRYTDGKSHTLSLVVKNEHVERFTIGVMGNTVEWSLGRPLQCIQNSQPVAMDEYQRKQLVKFVNSIEDLDREHREAIEKTLLSA